ncbi:MAG: fibronectin type III domain-containing protein, partial [Candidatus Thermoplasmatota archaeon]
MRRKMLFAIFIAGILLSIFPANAESNYGETNIGEASTSETIIPDEGGHLPNIPSNPSPPNNAVNIAIDVTLSWSGGDEDGDIIIYDIYFEENDSTPDIKIASTTETSYHLSNLKYSTTYY